MTNSANRRRQLELPVLANVVSAPALRSASPSRSSAPADAHEVRASTLKATPADQSIYDAITAEYLRTRNSR